MFYLPILHIQNNYDKIYIQKKQMMRLILKYLNVKEGEYY